MIQLVEQGLEYLPQIRKIHHPARVLTYFAADMNLDAERVPMNARAFVSIGNMGKAVSGFDLEYAKYIHGAIVPSASAQRNACPGLFLSPMGLVGLAA